VKDDTYILDSAFSVIRLMCSLMWYGCYVATLFAMDFWCNNANWNKLPKLGNGAFWSGQWAV